MENNFRWKGYSLIAQGHRLPYSAEMKYIVLMCNICYGLQYMSKILMFRSTENSTSGSLSVSYFSLTSLNVRSSLEAAFMTKSDFVVFLGFFFSKKIRNLSLPYMLTTLALFQTDGSAPFLQNSSHCSNAEFGEKNYCILDFEQYRHVKWHHLSQYNKVQ